MTAYIHDYHGIYSAVFFDEKDEYRGEKRATHKSEIIRLCRERGATTIIWD